MTLCKYSYISSLPLKNSLLNFQMLPPTLKSLVYCEWAFHKCLETLKQLQLAKVKPKSKTLLNPMFGKKKLMQIKIPALSSPSPFLKSQTKATNQRIKFPIQIIIPQKSKNPTFKNKRMIYHCMGIPTNQSGFRLINLLLAYHQIRILEIIINMPNYMLDKTHFTIFLS
jgi:hypothetical protein